MLAALLYEMGRSLNYSFDKTYIKRSIYCPQGHVDMENDLWILRRKLVDLMSGKSSLPVLTISPQPSAVELKSQKKEQEEQELIRKLLISHYKGEIPSVVKILHGNEEAKK